MKILLSFKPMLNFVGLMFNYSNNFFYKLYGFFWFACSCSYVIPEALYFYLHLDDILKATDVLIFLGVTIMTLTKMCLFYYYKQEYADLIDRLGNNAMYKIEINSGKHYVEAENRCTTFKSLYHSTYILVLVLGLILPLFVVFYNYLLGQLTPDVWYLPFPGILFFNTETTPGFQIAYVIIAFSLIGILCSYVCIDSLFVGMCIYLTAGYRDLQDMIIEMNNPIKQNQFLYDPDGVLLYHSMNDEKAVCQLKKDIENCVEFQQFLTECFNKVQEVNSGIIFTQFSGTVFIICACLFQMTITLENGKVVSFINICCCYLTQLFVYAVYGNMVPSEINNLSTTIYNSIWYRRPVEFRKQFYLMILKSQTVKYFRGIKLINCSMESFSSVLRAAGSAFALLQSIKEKV